MIADGNTVSPGRTVSYPNRERPAARATKAIIVALVAVSVALMLVVTIGGWSELAGMRPVDFLLCAAYVVIAFFLATRWARGLLPILTALATLLLIVSLADGVGAAGPSWFDRSGGAFAQAASGAGGGGLSPDLLGLATLLLVPLQALVIGFAMTGFAQGWNVELELPTR